MQLPDFDESVRALDAKLTMEEMTESHGLLCGLLCAHPDLSLAAYKSACLARDLPLTADDESSAVAHALLESSRMQLQDPDMAIGLWLPADDEPLSVRTVSLGAWCSGFLTGLAQACGEGLMQVSGEISEIVNDLGEIAQAGIVADSESESEIEENAYVEIVEYVRVAILLVREELRGPQDRDSVH